MRGSPFDNQRFGRLVALRRSGNDGHGNAVWVCACDCGATVAVSRPALRSGSTRSCGCLRRESIGQIGRSHVRHGHTAGRIGGKQTISSTYKSWMSMKLRCLNPRAKGYEDYGGRGITIARAWADDFAAFLADMGERQPGTSIERINNDGHYEPGNCRWATVKEQAQNRRRSSIDRLMITRDGITRSLPEWAASTGINKTTLYRRRQCGWTVERLLTPPPTNGRSRPRLKSRQQAPA